MTDSNCIRQPMDQGDGIRSCEGQSPATVGENLLACRRNRTGLIGGQIFIPSI